jgi:hypothetical protein
MAPITGVGDATEVDDRLVQRLGAAADLGRQVNVGVANPFLEPVDVAA